MAELSEQQRNDLKDSDFAYIDKQGKRHLPIHDEQHVKNAAARFDQTDFGSAQEKADAAHKIKAAATRHGVTLAPNDAVSKAAR